ncbi:hypothetical protein [Micromonospora echinaurantiaca]|uniref:hypothetical protein n=1 Tax=Micromonospora echinaurantiaca TaxID=47857 RepID=UPI0012FD3F24|nr:hypothetical protein [Micromonospora echinaurantiaca]
MRLSAGTVCWSVVGGAAVVHVLGALSDAPVLAGQATGVALAGLAAIVLLGGGRGRPAVAAGVAVLAVDAVVAARDLGGPRYLSPFYAPLSTPGPYSVGTDLAWLGEALSAQLTEHWPTLLGVSLICGGTVLTLADRPRTEARWPRRIGWAVVAVVAVVLLVDFGGGTLARRLVTLAARVPTMVAVAAALAVLVVAAGRRWRSGVPAVLGALLLTAAVLSADLTATGPARPMVWPEADAVAEPQAFLAVGVRSEAFVATAILDAPSAGLVTAPLLALLAVLAIGLLALAAPGRGGGGTVGRDGPDGEND